MQIKCSYCSLPFAITKEEVDLIIEKLTKEKLEHYDAHCPRCRRAARVTKKMLMLNPLYRRALEEA